MAQRVVDDFEAVEVHKEDRDLSACLAPGASEGLHQAVDEELAVG